jgi:hypothetical protein
MMQNKNILVITPFFAPETHAAVFRAYKLVKYLKREGWNPIVLTVNTNYVYNEDTSLLEDLKDVTIYRTKYIEPSLRGLYMLLTGKDRTFKTLKRQGHYNNTSVNNELVPISKKNKLSLKQKIYNFLLNNYLNVPDRFWTWKRGAVIKANKLIKEFDINYVYTTMPPFTTGSIGLAIKKENPNIKWIADFRDPLTTVLRNHSNIESVFIKQRRIEHEVVKKTDSVITASLSHKNILHDIFKGKYFEKIHFIPTGLDDDFWVKKSLNLENTIIYSGEYLIENGFYIFDLLIKYNSTATEKLTLKIIGNKEINLSLIQKNLKNDLLLEYVHFVDHLSQKKLYEEIVKAKACLLISEGRWWCSFAKMVDYIALQVPVLAQVPEISEAKTQLTKANLGFFLTGNIKNDLKIITTLIENKENKPNKEFCSKYLASSQVKDFINIIEKL